MHMFIICFLFLFYTSVPTAHVTFYKYSLAVKHNYCYVISFLPQLTSNTGAHNGNYR